MSKLVEHLAHFDAKIENLELESKAGCPFQSHLLSRAENSNLILWPHGGPNSCITIDFVPLFTGLTELGYDILAVNYVGSIGYGQNSIRALAGHIGDYDVADCLSVKFIEQLVNSYSIRR